SFSKERVPDVCPAHRYKCCQQALSDTVVNPSKSSKSASNSTSNSQAANAGQERMNSTREERLSTYRRRGRSFPRTSQAMTRNARQIARPREATTRQQVTPEAESGQIALDLAVQTLKEEDMRHPESIWTDPAFANEPLPRL